jgi:hypothetical protein
LTHSYKYKVIFFCNFVPYVRFYSLYLEVKLNNAETSYLNLPSLAE